MSVPAVHASTSAVVILTEATRSLDVTPLFMLPIMFAKWVGDLFNEGDFFCSQCWLEPCVNIELRSGLYDIHIRLNGVPRLEYDPPAEAQFLIAQELQAVKKAKEITVLPVIVRVRDLIDLLKVSVVACSPKGFAAA